MMIRNLSANKNETILELGLTFLVPLKHRREPLNALYDKGSVPHF
jgi:hypothetical protein